jgi:hypothetical protein
MKTKLVLTLFALFLLLLPGSSRGTVQADARSAALGTAITYQGRLADGGVAANGSYDFQFTLYNAETGGAQVGSLVPRDDVLVSEGYFTVQLDFGVGAFGSEARWLEVAVRPGTSTGSYTVLNPRQALTPAPSALYAASAGSASSASSVPWSGLSGVPAGFADGLDNDTLYSAGTGLGLSSGQFSLNATYRLPQGCAANQVPKWNGSAWTCAADDNTTAFWSLTGNTGTNPSSNYLGTSDNQAFEIRVNGQRAIRIIPAASANLVAGYSANTITAGVEGATISGGGSSNDFSTNFVYDSWGTVGGGAGNMAGYISDVLTDQAFATVSGGNLNAAQGVASSVGGGWGNRALGGFATVGGGTMNLASGSYSSVGGGRNNTAGGESATVGGGNTNTASGNSATIGGGANNTASQIYSSVGAGVDNVASGVEATIPGGRKNVASGAISFAAGNEAIASSDGTFVWADATNHSFAPFSYPTPGGIANSFNARATGGVYLVTGVNASTGVPTAGMFLAGGGSGWNVYSDRSFKMNFQTVNSLNLLERLAAIPISSWNYKTQAASVRHIGPMAQDFNGAFGLGEADKAGEKKYINSIDADGVALAAIQGLYQLNQQQAAEIKSLKVQLSRLEKSGSPQTTSSLPIIWVVVGLLGLSQVGIFLALRRRMGGRS